MARATRAMATATKKATTMAARAMATARAMAMAMKRAMAMAVRAIVTATKMGEQRRQEE